MRTPAYDVWLRGGLASTAELRALGHTARALSRAIATGSLVRVRRGILASPDLDPLELLAAQCGGRLTGAAGARRHGIWAPDHDVVDIALDPHARSPRPPSTARTRSSWSATVEPGTRTLVGPVGCLTRIARTEDARFAFAALESARHGGVVTRAEVHQVIGAAPRGVRRVLARAGGLSESGGESLLAFGMLRAGIPFAQQVPVAGVGRVDFLVGTRLIVEVDGAEFHATREAFERDRRRDAVAAARGCRSLRFSYSQVLHRWGEVDAALRAALHRGDHR